MKVLMRHNIETQKLFIYAKYGSLHTIVEADEPDAGKAHRLEAAIRRAEDAAYQAGANAVRDEVDAAIKRIVA